jgi:hypothetical protein
VPAFKNVSCQLEGCCPPRKNRVHALERDLHVYCGSPASKCTTSMQQGQPGTCGPQGTTGQLQMGLRYVLRSMLGAHNAKIPSMNT